MDLKLLLENIPYLMPDKEYTSNDEKEIILKILENAKIKDHEEIIFLSSNYNYDIYKVKLKNSWICIKYSLDENDSYLLREYDTLSNIKNFCAPKVIAHNKFKYGDVISYLIISYENAENLKDLGLGTLIENLDSFFGCYFSLQKNNLPKNTFSSYLSNILSENNFSILKVESNLSIKIYENFHIFENIVSDLIEDIKTECNLDIFDKDDFCHGNLKPSNILQRDGLFKFINFERAFSGNFYFDLASIIIETNSDKETEKNIFNLFLQKQNKSFNIQDFEEYKKCYSFILKIKLLELIFNFIKEVYEFESSREDKIFNIILSFIYNVEKFINIKTVNENYNFLYSTMIEPLVGSKDVNK